ncbi:hypothetical protein H5410_015306 [Solanum commersonii]|uniref:Uncharacterized protein n=1 Tax=Solanum commersonii TaxID=4109 RepID=A0A9J5ZU02_SOLCO|nr:hypothetical protein H5410_015306 [Solanum commersonii]
MTTNENTGKAEEQVTDRKLIKKQPQCETKKSDAKKTRKGGHSCSNSYATTSSSLPTDIGVALLVWPFPAVVHNLTVLPWQ